jgi:hypothetical protein
MTVAAERPADPALTTDTRRPNLLLRQARLRTPSPADPDRAMSQRELAEALNAHVFRTTARVVPLDRHYISRLERGVRRYPIADYRAAFRAVLGGATDAELGFGRPPGRKRRALALGAVTRLLVLPGMAVIVMPTDHPRLLTVTDREEGSA